MFGLIYGGFLKKKYFFWAIREKILTFAGGK